MSEDIKVSTTPIQRNLNDVAVELTALYFKAQNNAEYTIEQIQGAYKEFYTTAKEAQRGR